MCRSGLPSWSLMHDGRLADGNSTWMLPQDMELKLWVGERGAQQDEADSGSYAVMSQEESQQLAQALARQLRACLQAGHLDGEVEFKASLCARSRCEQPDVGDPAAMPDDQESCQVMGLLETRLQSCPSRQVPLPGCALFFVAPAVQTHLAASHERQRGHRCIILRFAMCRQGPGSVCSMLPKEGPEKPISGVAFNQSA